MFFSNFWYYGAESVVVICIYIYVQIVYILLMRKILLLLPFFLWTCGGGGGSNDSDSPTGPTEPTIITPNQSLFSSSIPYQARRGWGSVFQISDNIYFLGGYNIDTDTTYDDFYVYSISQRTWTKLANAPMPFYVINYSSNTNYNGKIYAGTSSTYPNPDCNDYFASYDIQSNTWSKYSIFGDDCSNDVNLARHSIYEYNGSIYGLRISNNPNNKASLLNLQTGEQRYFTANGTNGFTSHARLNQFDDKYFFFNNNNVYQYRPNFGDAEGVISLHSSIDYGESNSPINKWGNFIINISERASSGPKVQVLDLTSFTWTEYSIPSDKASLLPKSTLNNNYMQLLPVKIPPIAGIEQGLFALVALDNNKSTPYPKIVYFNLEHKTFSVEP